MKVTKELFDEVKLTLTSCKNSCDSACYECLKHFRNQRLQIVTILDNKINYK